MATRSSSSQQISKTTAQFAEVIASPGSGKTYALIQRKRHLIASGVPAEQILVLSFSNTTVDELKRRIASPTAPAADNFGDLFYRSNRMRFAGGWLIPIA